MAAIDVVVSPKCRAHDRDLHSSEDKPQARTR